MWLILVLLSVWNSYDCVAGIGVEGMRSTMMLLDIFGLVAISSDTVLEDMLRIEELEVLSNSSLRTGS
jgi:hypothetical protein